MVGVVRALDFALSYFTGLAGARVCATCLLINYGWCGSRIFLPDAARDAGDVMRLASLSMLLRIVTTTGELELEDLQHSGNSFIASTGRYGWLCSSFFAVGRCTNVLLANDICSSFAFECLFRCGIS